VGQALLPIDEQEVLLLGRSGIGPAFERACALVPGLDHPLINGRQSDWLRNRVARLWSSGTCDQPPTSTITCLLALRRPEPCAVSV
jgi:hypothetical protein